jgi:hypothetical protein
MKNILKCFLLACFLHLLSRGDRSFGPLRLWHGDRTADRDYEVGWMVGIKLPVQTRKLMENHGVADFISQPLLWEHGTLQMISIRL